MNKIDEIKALKDIVQQLPDRNLYEQTNIGLKRLKTRKGVAFVSELEHFEDCSCEKSLFGEGTEVDWHFHKVIEILIVIKGEIHIFVGDEPHEVILSRADVFKLNPDEKHYALFPKDTELYVIKIPSE